MSDAVNHPSHYQGKIEAIDAIHAALGDEGIIAHCKGNAMKYTYRAGKKGSAKEDILKAIWYLKFAVKVLDEIEAREQPEAEFDRTPAKDVKDWTRADWVKNSGVPPLPPPPPPCRKVGNV